MIGSGGISGKGWCWDIRVKRDIEGYDGMGIMGKLGSVKYDWKGIGKENWEVLKDDKWN